MAVYDTTNYIDTSLHLKSKLKKNFATDNYWIESFQDKIDSAWEYATDIVDIEESIESFNEYQILKMPNTYKHVETRIMSAYTEKGVKLSDDFKKVVFQSLTHPLRLGQKYKFDIKNFQEPLEKNKSIWLNMNFDNTNMGASAIFRRCNCTLGFLINDKTTEWYEPAIVENEFSYTNIDFNTAIKIPQDELYITVQYNEYTKDIAVSDRFIIGALDFENISNNIVYKVKAVHRVGANNTYNNNTISFVNLALDRDSINIEDDYIYKDSNGVAHYIANYYTFKKQSNTSILNDANYYLKITPDISMIREGNTENFECYLYNQNQIIEDKLKYNFELPMTDNDKSYYKAVIVDDNHFNITVLRKYYKSDLFVTVMPSDQYRENVSNLIFKIRLEEAL